MYAMRLFLAVVIALLSIVHFELLPLVSESLQNLYAALSEANRDLRLD
jgi:hypothetical protein